MAGVGAALVSGISMSCVRNWFYAKVGMALGTAMAGHEDHCIGYSGALQCGVVSGEVATAQGWTFEGCVDIRCFKDSRSTRLTIGTFCLELVFFALLGLLLIYVVNQEFRTSQSVNLLVVLNAFNCVGRLLAGHFADGYGRLNILILLIAFAVLLIFAIIFPFSHSIVALYIFCALYGLSSGSFINLAPVCVRQVSPAEEIGMRFGTLYCLASFATLICIPIGEDMLEKVRAHMVVVWLGAVLVVSTVLFAVARWACLHYKWDWRSKIERLTGPWWMGSSSSWLGFDVKDTR
ncbi:major facilitator superfamily domain-containing protein [Aspergillus cavernicola]|uniref:Major facilitator superfamily domain-containing protein n=1 Tax=Aspergillus cavernicola TaxID=176166 RepID=A0ABR4HKP3_9EURO